MGQNLTHSHLLQMNVTNSQFEERTGPTLILFELYGLCAQLNPIWTLHLKLWKCGDLGLRGIGTEPVCWVFAESLQLCTTLCDPMDCSPPGSSVHGIFQAKILEWVAMPSSSRGSFLPRAQTRVYYVSCFGKLVLHHSRSLGSHSCDLVKCSYSDWFCSEASRGKGNFT